jgi:predicted AlkP superfamily pyrophosphatase or phosphodiesterase
MRAFRLFIMLLTSGFAVSGQGVSRPKLVVGLVIDQMRWDYLYRYSARYGNDGFKRLLGKGFSCENTMVNYLPSFTGPGHACVYTGSVPAIHGIAANDWIDNVTGKNCYCVGDETVCFVDDTAKKPSMSPTTLLVTTITDELRLATNFKSRVYGVALKDRASILPAGHLANAAYWYNDKTGNFTTSTYYSNQNPKWLQAFNQRRLVDSFVAQGWKLMGKPSEYTQSLADANNYEEPYKGEQSPVFPHSFDKLAAGDKRKIIKSIPAGNTYSFMMAKACIDGEQLGSGEETDFLALSLSASDYVGHQFGPNSIETEDMYVRLDRDIADFLNYLDNKAGAGNYLFFLTADHGGAHNVQFLNDKKVPAGFTKGDLRPQLDSFLKSIYFDFKDAAKKEKFRKESIVYSFINDQVYLNDAVIASAGIDRDMVKKSISDYFRKMPEIAWVADLEQLGNANIPEPIKTMLVNGYSRLRSGNMEIIYNPAWYEDYARKGTTHGSWNPYDAHIPLLWYGWHVLPGATNKVVNMTDISPTLAALLHIQMPNGCIGKPIAEVTDQPPGGPIMRKLRRAYLKKHSGN